MPALRVSGFGFRVMVSGFGFRVSGFRFRVSGNGFGLRVSGDGFGFWVVECPSGVGARNLRRISSSFSDHSRCAVESFRESSTTCHDETVIFDLSSHSEHGKTVISDLLSGSEHGKTVMRRRELPRVVHHLSIRQSGPR